MGEHLQNIRVIIKREVLLELVVVTKIKFLEKKNFCDFFNT